MSAGTIWIIMGVIFVVTCGLTGAVRRYALRRGILDVPNARRSHTLPTPRGGGLAVVVVFLTSIIFSALRGIISKELAWAICGGGLLVAGIGWLDDRRGLPPLPRAVVQGLAALWALGWLGGLPSLDLGVTRLFLGPVGFLPGLLGSSGALTSTTSWTASTAWPGLRRSPWATAALLLAGRKAGLFPSPGPPGPRRRRPIGACRRASCSRGAGFWSGTGPRQNLHGRRGERLSRLYLRYLGRGLRKLRRVAPQVWVLLLGVFVVDATATLLRRIRRGERWTEAHRTHAYQLAVQARWTHKQATLAVLGINLLLGLAAAAACLWPRALLLVVGLAGTALVFFWARVVKSCEAHRRSRMEEGIREAAAASSSQPPASF